MALWGQCCSQNIAVKPSYAPRYPEPRWGWGFQIPMTGASPTLEWVFTICVDRTKDDPQTEISNSKPEIILELYEPCHENLFFAYAKTNTQISCAVTAQLISAFVFAQGSYNPSTYKIQNFTPLTIYSPICVGPGRKPRRQVFP